MKIDFIRHGQTHWNIAGKNNGQSEEDALTPEGIEQAHKTLETLSSDYAEIYSSDLLRARQTAEILNKKFNLEIKYDKRLRERSTGTLLGKTWEELGAALKAIDKSMTYDYRKNSGESVEEVKERLFELINEVVKNNKGQKVLMVTHGGIISLLHHVLNGKVPEKIHNASVHEFEFK